jgi:pyrimidine operon attenuation protein/uracil phosphoribosyltransferase
MIKNMTNTIILNQVEIKHKTKRIAFQILETFSDEHEIIIAGIATNGYKFAEQIAESIAKITHMKVILCEVHIDKTNPQNEIKTSLLPNEYADKCIVLVDDVLNSGTTLIYSVKHFLNVPLKKFKTAVLVDRNHKKYPVKVDFKGISLSTSLSEHVQVVFEEHDQFAFLSNIEV